MVIEHIRTSENHKAIALALKHYGRRLADFETPVLDVGDGEGCRLWVASHMEWHHLPVPPRW